MRENPDSNSEQLADEMVFEVIKIANRHIKGQNPGEEYERLANDRALGKIVMQTLRQCHAQSQEIDRTSMATIAKELLERTTGAISNYWERVVNAKLAEDGIWDLKIDIANSTIGEYLCVGNALFHSKQNPSSDDPLGLAIDQRSYLESISYSFYQVVRPYFNGKQMTTYNLPTDRLLPPMIVKYFETKFLQQKNVIPLFGNKNHLQRIVNAVLNGCYDAYEECVEENAKESVTPRSAAEIESLQIGVLVEMLMKEEVTNDSSSSHLNRENRDKIGSLLEDSNS